MFPRRRISQANPLNPDQMATLVKANQWVAQGKPLEAGPLFAQVASAMQASNHPRRAANLFTRAAHAFVDGNRGQVGLGYARAAISLFLQTQMIGRAASFYTNITRKMAAKGMNNALGELQKEFGAHITNLPTKPLSMPPLRRKLLPTSCPKCGAPVHMEDIIWVDEATAECEFCGSLIRSE